LVHDKELQLYDGTRLLGEQRYNEIKEQLKLNDEDMKQRGILPIKSNFRIVALAEPPVIGGSNKEQWLTAEVLSMFLCHVMRPLSEAEEHHVLTSLGGSSGVDPVLEDVLRLTHVLRVSEDPSLRSLANSLSTRQLLRISRRLRRFSTSENAYSAVHKACLARFLPCRYLGCFPLCYDTGVWRRLAT